MYDTAAIMRRAHDIVRRRIARNVRDGVRWRLGLGPISYAERMSDALRTAWMEARA